MHECGEDDPGLAAAKERGWRRIGVAEGQKVIKATPTPQPRAATPTCAAQADYDAAVLSTIRRRRTVGLVYDPGEGRRLDRCGRGGATTLQRLVAAGQVVRVGERKLTHYWVAGQS
jgi:hypothetical protein